MADEVAEALSEPQENVAHRDDVHNDVAAAIASLKGESDASSDAAGGDDRGDEHASANSADAAPEARARDSSGKFIPKSEAAPDQTQAAPEKVVAAPQSPAKESPSEPSAQPSTAAGAAPGSWPADAKALWAALPPAVQAAALKRERDAEAGIVQYSEKARHYEQALAPIAQEAQRRGMSPDDAIKRLIDGNAFLETQPQQAILWLAQKNGIDLAQLASNPPEPPARPDPAYAQVNQTVQSLEQRLAQFEFDKNLTVAQQFAASKPHYADVEASLPQFIKELRALDPSLGGVDLLEKAYERAVWLSPEVRAKVQNAERETAEKAKQAEVQAKAQQASRAAVSVKGSSAVAVAPRRQEAAEDETAYDSVRSALRQLRAG